MNALQTVDALNSIVSITRFNDGEANEIFSEVKVSGTKIVVKTMFPNVFW